jgi:hypothetical protein
MKTQLHKVKLQSLGNETEQEELGQAQYLRDQASQLYQTGGPGHEGKAIHLLIRATIIEDRYKPAFTFDRTPIPVIPFRVPKREKAEDRAMTERPTPPIAYKEMPEQLSFGL